MTDQQIKELLHRHEFPGVLPSQSSSSPRSRRARPASASRTARESGSTATPTASVRAPTGTRCTSATRTHSPFEPRLRAVHPTEQNEEYALGKVVAHCSTSGTPNVPRRRRRTSGRWSGNPADVLHRLSVVLHQRPDRSSRQRASVQPSAAHAQDRAAAADERSAAGRQDRPCDPLAGRHLCPRTQEHQPQHRPIRTTGTRRRRTRRSRCTPSRSATCRRARGFENFGIKGRHGERFGNTLYDVWHKPTIKPKMLTQADTKAFIETGTTAVRSSSSCGGEEAHDARSR
jgi:hypothetical protein